VVGDMVKGIMIRDVPPNEGTSLDTAEDASSANGVPLGTLSRGGKGVGLNVIKM